MKNNSEKEPKKFDKWKIRYTVYGVIALLCIGWSMLGMQFITAESDGMTCFFLATLPVLLFFAMLTFLAVTRFKQQREKRRNEQKQQDERKKK